MLSFGVPTLKKINKKTFFENIYAEFNLCEKNEALSQYCCFFKLGGQ
jgi:hypothetical protein